MFNKRFLAVIAGFGATGVALGAFGAHGLQQLTADEKILKGFQTAVFYQLIHTLAMFMAVSISEKYPGKWINRAFYSFCIGIILFSGSIYGITALKISALSGYGILGPVTPAGGLFLVTGWLCVLLAVFKR